MHLLTVFGPQGNFIHLRGCCNHMQYGRPTLHPHACTYTVAHLVTCAKIHPRTSVCAHPHTTCTLHMCTHTCMPTTHMHTHNTHIHTQQHTHTRANLRDVEERNQVDKCSRELLPHLLQDLYKMLLKVIGGQEGNITRAPTKEEGHSGGCKCCDDRDAGNRNAYNASAGRCTSTLCSSYI